MVKWDSWKTHVLNCFQVQHRLRQEWDRSAEACSKLSRACGVRAILGAACKHSAEGLVSALWLELEHLAAARVLYKCFFLIARIHVAQRFVEGCYLCTQFLFCEVRCTKEFSCIMDLWRTGWPPINHVPFIWLNGRPPCWLSYLCCWVYSIIVACRCYVAFGIAGIQLLPADVLFADTLASACAVFITFPFCFVFLKVDLLFFFLHLYTNLMLSNVAVMSEHFCILYRFFGGWIVLRIRPPVQQIDRKDYIAQTTMVASSKRGTCCLPSW